MQSVGIKIAVDGGAAFREEISSLTQKGKELASELKAVTSSFDLTGDASKKAAAQMDVLSREMQNQRSYIDALSRKLSSQTENLEKLKKALAEAEKQYGKDSKEADQLRNAIAKQETEISKTNTAMNNAVTALNKMEGEYREAESAASGAADAMGDVGDAAQEAGAKAEKSGKGGWSVLGGIFANLASQAISALGSALVDLTKEALKAEDQITKFEQTMSFAGFGEDEIENATKAMKDYADKTVYELEDISSAMAGLAANGVDNYVELTEALGNLNAVAGGNSESFSSLQLMITQTAAAGKLTTENWNQLANAVPGASGIIQDALLKNGAYTGNFREAMAKGEITAEEFNQAIMDLGLQDGAIEAATKATTLESAFGNLKANAVSAIMNIIDAIGMENITGFINSIADFISDPLIPIIQKIIAYIKDPVIPTVIEIGTKIGNFVKDAIERFTTFKNNVLTTFNNIKTTISTVWNNIKTTISTVVNSIRSTVSSTFTLIKTKISTTVNSIKSTVESIFNKIKSAIEDPITTAKETVHDMIEKIKGFFNFEWSLPSLKLPHIDITGKFSLSPLSVPHFSINWYKKAATEGALFASPTVIGVGDARQPEMLIGQDTLRKMISEMAGGGNSTTVNVTINAAEGQNVNVLADLVATKIQNAVNRKGAAFS